MSDWEGDETLAELAEHNLGKGHRVAAIATVTGAGSSIAYRGIEPDADFEIGSIAKAITALLYTEALDDDIIDVATVLGDLLPLNAQAPAAHVALRAIATHRSGLPSLPPAMKPWRRTAKWLVTGANPYGDTLEEVLEQTDEVRLGSTRPRYSNLGFQLLGHAVASARGCGYQELLEKRIATPLGLSTFYAPYTKDELRSTSLIGRTGTRGRPREPWVGEAFAPCGGIRATIGVMCDFTAALLNGTAPGMAALDPVERFSGQGTHIGAAWITSKHKGREVTWHNGATGGFCSWLGLDRQAGTGVVVLTARFRPVDQQGMRLLADVTSLPGRRSTTRRQQQRRTECDQRRNDTDHPMCCCRQRVYADQKTQRRQWQRVREDRRPHTAEPNNDRTEEQPEREKPQRGNDGDRRRNGPLYGHGAVQRHMEQHPHRGHDHR